MLLARIPRPAVFITLSIYFSLGALSAVWWPNLWYQISGLTPPAEDLPLAVVGALLASLGAGAALAALHPQSALGLNVVLILANLFDLLIMWRAYHLGELNLTAAGAYIFLDSARILILGSILIQQIREQRAQGNFNSCCRQT